MNYRLFFSLLCLCSFFAVRAQTMADSLFTAGVQLYQLKDYEKAINCFKQIVLDHKEFHRYNQSVYNLAYTYDSADSSEQAIVWYEFIRSSDMKDNDEVGGRGVFEPYANYKHFATFNIANMEYNRGNYEKALEYYRQCQTTYHYRNTSGTDMRINENRLIIYIVDCHKMLKDYDAALATILPQVLDSEGSMNYASLVNTTLKLIEENYDKQAIATELEQALHSLKRNKKEECFEFTWRGKSMELFPYDSYNDQTVDAFSKSIKQSKFWEELTKN